MRISNVRNSNATDLLIVGSHAADLLALASILGDQLEGTYMGVQVRAKAVGVGLAVAGSATTRGILGTQPRAVLHIGTAGVYPDAQQFRSSAPLVATEVRLVDHVVLAGHAQFNEPVLTSVEADLVLTRALETAGATRVDRIASTLSITTDRELAGTVFSATQCAAENGEAFAIAMACRALGIPYTSLLGCTHVIGPTFRTDWSTHHREAMHQVVTVCANWIARGAAGIPTTASV